MWAHQLSACAAATPHPPASPSTLPRTPTHPRATAPPPISPPLTLTHRRHKGGAPCGCCYAFGGMAGIEAANTLYTGELTTLSEQEIVDCDQYDYGCNGEH